MKQYRLKVGRIGEFFVDRYYDIEYTVVGAYKAIEHGMVDRYKKLERTFVETFLEETDER